MPLDATMTGQGTFTTSLPGEEGLFPLDLTIGIEFSADRTAVAITSFPTITFSTPPEPLVGVVTYTVIRGQRRKRHLRLKWRDQCSFITLKPSRRLPLEDG